MRLEAAALAYHDNACFAHAFEPVKHLGDGETHGVSVMYVLLSK